MLIRDPIASGTMRAIFGAIVVRSVADRLTEQGSEWLSGSMRTRASNAQCEILSKIRRRRADHARGHA